MHVRKNYIKWGYNNRQEILQAENLNDGMECVFRYYGRSLNQSKDPLPPRDDVMEFDVLNNTKELENNLKGGFPSCL